MDDHICQLHREVIINSLSIFPHGLQQVKDNLGHNLHIFTNGETIYGLQCKEINAIARNTPGICCQELLIMIREQETALFTVAKYKETFALGISQTMQDFISLIINGVKERTPHPMMSAAEMFSSQLPFAGFIRHLPRVIQAVSSGHHLSSHS